MCRFALAVAFALAGCAAANSPSPDSVQHDLATGSGDDSSSDFGEVLTSNDDMATPSQPGDDLSHAPFDLARPTTPLVDMATPTVPCPVAQHLVINEVQANGSGDSSNEFVELYNPCAQPVAIGGFKLLHRSASGSIDTPTLTMPAGKSIDKNGYFIIVGPTYAGKAPFDVQYSTAMLSGTGGGLALQDGSGKMIDSMGWGSGASNAYIVGKSAPAAPDGQSMARTPNGSGSHGDNAQDFQVAVTPTPRLSN